jgi:hypothetical protein
MDMSVAGVSPSTDPDKPKALIVEFKQGEYFPHDGGWDVGWWLLDDVAQSITPVA